MMKILIFLFLCFGVNISTSSHDDFGLEEYKDIFKKFKLGEIPIDYKSPDGRSLAFLAAQFGDAKDLIFLASKKVDLKAIGVGGLHPIVVTVSDSCMHEKLKVFLDCGHPVNVKVPVLGWSLIHMAAAHRDTSCLELLISRGVNFNAHDSEGKNAFFYAKTKEAANILWGNGLDIFEKDDYGFDAIHYAILINSSPEIYSDILQEIVEKRVLLIRQKKENNRTNKDK